MLIFSANISIRKGIAINDKIDAREEYLLKKAINNHKKTKIMPI